MQTPSESTRSETAQPEVEQPYALTGFARRQVIAVTLTSLFTDISSEMMFNMLPLYLSNVLGAPTGIIGLIEGVAETTASLLKSASGWLSDKLRQRKRLTVAGYSLSAVSKPFLLIAATWQGVLAVRFADRAGKGIRTAPRDALIADSINERQRGIAFGLHRAGDTAGAVIGLIIALIVVLAMQAQAVELSRATFLALVALSIIPAFVAVIILVAWARDVPIKVKDKARALGLSFRALNPQFRYFLLIVTIFTLGNSSDAFLVLRAQERGLSVAGVLGMLITFNVVYSALAGPAGALSDRIGRRRLIIVGWLVYGAIYLGFAAAATTWQIWALYGLYGLYYGLVEGSARALVADLVPQEQRGTAYGFYNMAIGLVALPASLLAGVLWQGVGTWQGFGPSAPFLAGSVLALIAVALFAAWRPPMPANE
jgi:MFS family permease